MKILVMEMEWLRQLILALVGREEVGCTIGSSGGTVDDKVEEGDEILGRQSSPQPGRRLRGGYVTGWKETRRKETKRKKTGWNEIGWKEMGGNTMGVMEMGGKDMGAKAQGAKAPGVQHSQETGGKDDMLMGEREMDNSC